VLAKGSYDVVFSGVLEPAVFVHDDDVLGQFVAALRPSGVLRLAEPVLLEKVDPALSKFLPSKTADELVKGLKVTTFFFCSSAAARLASPSLLSNNHSSWALSSQLLIQ